MRRLFATLLRYSRLSTMIWAVVVGALSGLASTALLILINRSLNREGMITPWWALAFAGLCLFVAGARIASSSILVAMGAGIANTLQIELSRRVLSAPLRQLEEIGPHRLMASLFDDIAVITEAVAVIPNTFINLIVVIGSVVYLAVLSPKLVVSVLVAMALGIASFTYAAGLGVQRMRRGREIGDELFQHLRGLTEGTKELKTRRRRREELLAFIEEAASGFRGLRVTAQKIFIASASLGNLLFFIVIGLVLYVVPGVAALSHEASSGYVLLLLYMTGPLSVVLNQSAMVSQAAVAIEKIERLGLSLLADEERDSTSVLPTASWRQLELAGATHSYRRDEEETFLLGPLDLIFHPGELVFLTGGNGSGKTTLIKLLIGLYLPESGEVRFDGRAVQPDELDAYRHLFAVVFSDFFLFEKLLGLDSPQLDSKARQYLQKLRLENRVVVQHGRFSTIDLSQGQRKRLALLTAFLEDCPIFVFDEWAADQDPEFKEVFYYQILPELKTRGKTVFVISHDDRYYHVADRIIKLDYGKVVSDTSVATVAPTMA